MNPIDYKKKMADEGRIDFRDKARSQSELGVLFGINDMDNIGDSDLAPLLPDATPEEKVKYQNIADVPSDKQNLLPKNYNQLAQEEAKFPSDVIVDESGMDIKAPGVVEAGQLVEGNQFGLPASPASPESPKDKYEKLIAEYNKTKEQSDVDIAKARDFDRNAKLAGIIASSLGNYANASAQARIGNPLVKPTNIDLTAVTDVFSKEPGTKEDAKRRLETLKQQYDMLSKGDQDALKQQYLEVAQENAAANKMRAQNTGVNSPAEARKKEQFEYTKIKNMQEAFNKDKIVQKAEERINSAMTLREMATSNNPISQEAAKTFAARASGEVGALSDSDRAAYGGSPAIIQRIKQVAQQMLDGNLTAANKKFMADLADGFERAGKRDLNTRLSVFAKQASKRTEGTNEKQAAEIIRPDLMIEDSEAEESKKETSSSPSSDKAPVATPGEVVRFDPKSKRWARYDAKTQAALGWVK